MASVCSILRLANTLPSILKIENPVQKYSANIDNYYEFTNLLTALAQTLGEGYAIHKQDVFIKKQFHDETNDNHEFLSESYFRYFTGRTYTDVQTYLIITQENKKSHLFSFDSKKWRDFLVKIRKVASILPIWMEQQPETMLTVTSP